MKIGELMRRTGTSKETIHHYLREGLLRKPHKTKGNVANYEEPPKAEQFIVGRKLQEVMSLFVYYLYRRLSREGFDKYRATIETRRAEKT